MRYKIHPGVDESAGSGSVNASPPPPMPSSTPGLTSRAALALQQLPTQPLPPSLAKDCRRDQLQPRGDCSALSKFATDQMHPMFRQAWGPLEELLS